MQNLTTTETDRLTTAEMDHLRYLRGRVESARTFRSSVCANDLLDGYIIRLLRKGRSVEQIIAITTAN